MTLLARDSLRRIRNARLSLGLGIYCLRGALAPLVAKSAGYDWLFIDSEHGSLSTSDISEMSLAAMTAGVVPLVRVCRDALSEGTRALDNGALGIVVPHVNTVADARELVTVFRYPPLGTRSSGGMWPQYELTPPAPTPRLAELNQETLIIAMIETTEGLENAADIAAIDGIDGLLIGTNDLSLEMGIPGQIADERIQTAYRIVSHACSKSAKIFGMGGVYDTEWATHFIQGGVSFVLAGSDVAMLCGACKSRAELLKSII